MRKNFVVALWFVLSPSMGLADVNIQAPTKNLKSDYDNEVSFGGKGTISVQLEEEDEIKNHVFQLEGIDQWLQPWHSRIPEPHVMTVSVA